MLTIGLASLVVLALASTAGPRSDILGDTSQTPEWSAEPPTLNGQLTAEANYSNYFTGHCQPFTQDVSFIGNATGGTPPYTYFWEFGDGNTSTEQNPTHTYSWHSEPLAVNLTVTDANGTTAMTTVSFHTDPPFGCPTPAHEFPLVAIIAIVVGGTLAILEAAEILRRRRRS